MANYLGDFRLSDTFDTKFCTVNTSGAPTTLAGSPVISAYVGNSTTEITAGITLSVDFDSRTGMNNIRVVASGANGYATASNYQLVVTTGTVSGTSVVGYVVGEFSIENRSALMPTVATRTIDVTATGAAGIDWANVENPTTALNLSATNIDTDQVVASVTGAVGSVTGSVGSVTGNVGGNVTGSVGSVASGGITAASIATGAIDADALATDAVTEIAAGVRDVAVDGSVTLAQSLRLANSANGGILSGAATTTVAIRDLADTKDRVTATVDSNGNRLSVTTDLT
jgi:hypothetical protein